MTRKKGIIVGAVFLLVVSWLYIKMPAWRLQDDHLASGREASCSLKKAEDRQWAVCRYGSGGSIWLREGNAWVAANGEAHERVDALERDGRLGSTELSSIRGPIIVPAEIEHMLQK